MRTIPPVLVACFALASAAWAADDMKKSDGMMKESMTLEQCKDHMAMARKDAMAKKDDAMMKKDAMCADMVRKDEMMKKDAMFKKEEPMKK